jgi:predicted transcriptional regulator
MSEIRGKDPQDVADGLAAVVALRRLADLIEAAQVDRALREGWSWSEIAEALGVTRQAVHKKHAGRVAAAHRERAVPDAATIRTDTGAPDGEPEEGL